MRAVLILALILIFGGVALSQQPTARPGTSPPQGTSTPAPTGVGPKYLSEAFDINATNVGPKFNGHDIIAITKKITESPVLEPKSEFESSAEYERRKGSFRSQPLVGSITPDTYLAFMLEEGASLKYDADRQVLTVSLTGERVEFYLEKRFLQMDTVTVRSELRDERKYIGSNAFGAKVEVTQTFWEQYGLAFEPTSWVFANAGERFRRQFSSLIAMPPDEARRFKPNARILVICRLAEPWYQHSASRDKATINNPYETTLGKYFLQRCASARRSDGLIFGSVFIGRLSE